MQIVEVMYSSIQSDLQSILGVRNHPRCAFRSVSVLSVRSLDFRYLTSSMIPNRTGQVAEIEGPYKLERE